MLSTWNIQALDDRFFRRGVHHTIFDLCIVTAPRDKNDFVDELALFILELYVAGNVTIKRNKENDELTARNTTEV
jgi:hypothetical protein